MTRNSFTALAGMTAIAVIAAIVAVALRSAATAPETSGTGPLIPALAERLNQVTALVITAPGHSATITRPDPDSTLWTVAEKNGYPAARDVVRRTLLALSEAQTLEPRTATPDKYAKLALDDAEATHVTLRTADDKHLPTLLIGKPAQPDGFYARRAGEAQSWLADAHLSPPSADPLLWLERELPGVPRARVMSVTISRAGTPPLTISRTDPAQANFTVVGLPTSAPGSPAPKIKQTAVNEMSGIAEILSFEDVTKAEPDTKPDPATITTRLRTFDGAVLTWRIRQRDGQPWATLTASFDATKTTPSGPTPDEVQTSIREIQGRYVGWRHRLPETAAKDLTRSADTLVDAAEPPAAPPLPVAPTPAPPKP